MIPPVPDDLKAHVEAVRQHDHAALLALADRLYERGPEAILAALAALVNFQTGPALDLPLEPFLRASCLPATRGVAPRILRALRGLDANYLKQREALPLYWQRRRLANEVDARRTLRDLVVLTADRLYACPDVGAGTIASVQRALSEVGLTLAPSPPRRTATAITPPR